MKDSILTSLKARQKSKATRDLLDQLRQQAKIEVLEPGVSLDAKKPPLALDGQPLGAPGAPGALEMKPAVPGEGAAAEAGEPGEDRPAAAPSTP